MCEREITHAHTPDDPAGLKFVESGNVELQDFVVLLNVAGLQGAADLLTPEVRLKVVKKDLQQFNQRLVEHDHGWDEEGGGEGKRHQGESSDNRHSSLAQRRFWQFLKNLIWTKYGKILTGFTLTHLILTLEERDGGGNKICIVDEWNEEAFLQANTQQV